MDDQPTNDAAQNPESGNIAIEATPFTRAQTTTTSAGLSLKPVPLIIGGVFLILALAALFMFTARAVRFDIEPIPESLDITSGFITYRLGERFLMLPGEYDVQARLDGYRVFDTRLTVGDEPDQVFRYALTRLPGILEIATDPGTQAEVFVDQVLVGQTPIRIEEIEAGLHDILIRSERYLPFDTEITIEGRRIEQSLQAQLEPAWADISLRTLPAGATLFVDEIPIGETPLTASIIEGLTPLTIRKPGYKVWQSELVVVHSEHQSLPEIVLVKSDGKVAIRTQPAGANVTINERYRGQSPLSITLPPGNAYEVLLSRAGYEPVRRTIKVASDEDVSLNLTLKPVVGVIRLKVEPSGGELFVDGHSVGPATQQLTLTASRHELKIVKPGYADYVNTVIPRPGLSQQLLITLQTVDEARVAAIAQQIDSGNGDILNLIIPGAMQMGAGRRERGRRSNEILKDVILQKPFYLGIFEVTNEQFKAFDASHDSGVFGRALLTDGDRPVVNLSWQSAVRYCNWLSERNGLPFAYEQVKGRWQLTNPVTRGFRLPTEAEWAWAARYADGPEPQRFPWGDAMPPPDRSGNYADESAAGMVPYHIVGYNDGYRGPAPIGQYPPNALGIFDLAGNVSEWITDYYSVDLEREQLLDPPGPASGDYYVIRGSNYTNGRFSELRWTFRDYGSEARRDVGFRIARYVE